MSYQPRWRTLFFGIAIAAAAPGVFAGEADWYPSFTTNSSTFSAADSKMAATYKALSSLVDEDSKKSLLLKQREWLRTRDAVVEKELASSGESMAEGAATSLTKAREAELSRLVQALSSTDENLAEQTPAPNSTDEDIAEQAEVEVPEPLSLPPPASPASLVAPSAGGATSASLTNLAVVREPPVESSDREKEDIQFWFGSDLKTITAYAAAVTFVMAAFWFFTRNRRKAAKERAARVLAEAERAAARESALHLEIKNGYVVFQEIQKKMDRLAFSQRAAKAENDAFN
jgi:hypothetical protein